MEVTCLTASDLAFPMYDPRAPERSHKAQTYLDALRRADGIIIASPGYHATVSGLLKNALDYAEDLAADEPPYLDGRPVGCIAVAHGWQAAVATIRTLRDIVHALRAWPTPYGATINVKETPLSVDRDLDGGVGASLHLVGKQVVDFVVARAAGSSPKSRVLI